MFKNNKCFIKGLMLCIIIIFICNSNAYAAENNLIINTDNASDGYFSIYYFTPNPVKIKIGILFDKDVSYYNYDIGITSNYAFNKGDGLYTIIIYQNIRDDLYKQIASKKVDVQLDNKLSPYIISTYEVTFSKDDEVSKKASEICKWYFMPLSKACALHSYVYKNIVYDYDLKADIKSEKIKPYHPKAIDVLTNKKGICYDNAVLFAAMCRSQDIPCEIVKGYYKDTYHAWNKIYIKDKWYYIDPNTTVSNFLKNRKYYKIKGGD